MGALPPRPNHFSFIEKISFQGFIACFSGNVMVVYLLNVVVTSWPDGVLITGERCFSKCWLCFSGQQSSSHKVWHLLCLPFSTGKPLASLLTNKCVCEKESGFQDPLALTFRWILACHSQKNSIRDQQSTSHYSFQMCKDNLPSNSRQCAQVLRGETWTSQWGLCHVSIFSDNVILSPP